MATGAKAGVKLEDGVHSGGNAFLERETMRQEKHLHERLVFITTSLIGLEVEAHVKNGTVYDGIFHGAAMDKEYGVVLKMARKRPGSDGAAVVTGLPAESMVFYAKDLVMLLAKDVSISEMLDDDRRGAHDSFATDAEISAAAGFGAERELQPCTSTFHDRGSLKWDQFKINEQRFGVKTTYDEEIYTTKLHRETSSHEFRERQKQAERIAAEIEGRAKATENVHLREERGVAMEDDKYDEEALYGAVIRDDQPRSSAGRGVPIAARPRPTSEIIAKAGKGGAVDESLVAGHKQLRIQVAQARRTINAGSPYGSPGASQSPLQAAVSAGESLLGLNLDPAVPATDEETRQKFLEFKRSKEEDSTARKARELEELKNFSQRFSTSSPIASPRSGSQSPTARAAAAASRRAAAVQLQRPVPDRARTLSDADQETPTGTTPPRSPPPPAPPPPPTPPPAPASRQGGDGGRRRGPPLQPPPPPHPQPPPPGDTDGRGGAWGPATPSAPAAPAASAAPATPATPASTSTPAGAAPAAPATPATPAAPAAEGAAAGTAAAGTPGGEKAGEGKEEKKESKSKLNPNAKAFTPTFSAAPAMLPSPVVGGPMPMPPGPGMMMMPAMGPGPMMGPGGMGPPVQAFHASPRADHGSINEQYMEGMRRQQQQQQGPYMDSPDAAKWRGPGGPSWRTPEDGPEGPRPGMLPGPQGTPVRQPHFAGPPMPYSGAGPNQAPPGAYMGGMPPGGMPPGSPVPLLQQQAPQTPPNMQPQQQGSAPPPQQQAPLMAMPGPGMPPQQVYILPPGARMVPGPGPMQPGGPQFVYAGGPPPMQMQGGMQMQGPMQGPMQGGQMPMQLVGGPMGGPGFPPGQGGQMVMQQGTPPPQQHGARRTSAGTSGPAGGGRGSPVAAIPHVPAAPGAGRMPQMPQMQPVGVIPMGMAPPQMVPGGAPPGAVILQGPVMPGAPGQVYYPNYQG
eukprot:tig00000970_g5825.t1